jgi:hypothetical protein
VKARLLSVVFSTFKFPAPDIPSSSRDCPTLASFATSFDGLTVLALAARWVLDFDFRDVRRKSDRLDLRSLVDKDPSREATVDTVALAERFLSVLSFVRLKCSRPRWKALRRLSIR